MRASGPPDSGRWSLRFAPTFFAWIPVVWSDFWIVGLDEQGRWLAAGDRRREQLSVLSRTMSLDEASLAAAIAQARGQGFDVDRLVPVPHDRAAGAR